MAGGTWEATNLPKLPGFYMNFKSAGLAAVETGDRGTVVLPIKAHWGKINGFTTIVTESDILNEFGALEDTNGSTFYKTLKMCTLGGAKKILAYRLADSTAKEASLTLQNETDTDVVKITAKYVGERGNNFKLTIAPSLANEGTFDMKLYENTALLYTYSFATWAELIDTVNTANVYILASKAEGSPDISGKDIKNITSQALTGGNSGITGIANTDYIKLLDVLETQEFNILSLDGVTDEAIQTSIASWVTRMRTQGKKLCVLWVVLPKMMLLMTQ